MYELCINFFVSSFFIQFFFQFIYSDCGLYTSLFAEYMSNDVFDISHIDIDSKYYRQRYATLLWNYGKSKNDEGAISESEVTGTVASKKGGPRTHKEQVMDTTNYPTLKFRNRK